MAGEPTKTCPHCDADVPHYAVKCKHCFGDLTAQAPEAPKRGMWGWVLMLVFMAVLGGTALYSVMGTRSLAQVTISEESQSVMLVWTYYRRPPTTRSIPFQDIAKVELVTDASMFSGKWWEVFVVTAQGERILINRSGVEDLQYYAEDVVKKTRKPLIPINKVDIGSTVLVQSPEP